MKETNLAIEKLKNKLSIAAGILFAVFMAYHVVLLFGIPNNQIGRLIGIGIFFFLTVASFFALLPGSGIRLVRSLLIVTALSVNIIMRLFNAYGIFSELDLSYLPTVLNCAVYVFSELALLILLLHYLIIRHNKRFKPKRALSVVPMSVVIALLFLNLAMECVLLIKFHLNIDLSIITTLFSRFVYFSAFAVTAVSFMLPAQINKSGDSDQITASEQDKKDLVFSNPDAHKDKKTKSERRAPDESDLVFSEKDAYKNQTTKSERRTPDESDLVFSDPDAHKNKKTKSERRAPDKSDLVFSEKDAYKNQKTKSERRTPDESDLVFSDPDSHKKRKTKSERRVPDESDLVFSNPYSHKKSHSSKKRERRAPDESDLVFSNPDAHKSHSTKRERSAPSEFDLVFSNRDKNFHSSNGPSTAEDNNDYKV